MAEFEYQEDKDWVVWEGHWNFEKKLVFLKEFDGRQQICHIRITKTLFWIRIHDLSLMARNEYIGCLIGETLEKVEEVDLDSGEFVWSEYIRVRVMLDISRSLVRKKKINIGTINPVQITFSYE